jgi:hypothetical protein
VTAPWTICGGCLAPVNVEVTEADEHAGRGWMYSCPACDWMAEETPSKPSEHFDPPTALDNLARLGAVLGRLAESEALPRSDRDACRLLADLGRPS